MLGAVELGGTKCVAAIGDADGHVVAETRVPTTSVGATLGALVSFFEAQRGALGLIEAIGIGSFGPVDLNPQSPTYGYITTTPKPGWAQADLRGRIQRALNVPVAFDTDVNVAAFGEHYWVSENKALDPLLYMTVGTGIGVGGLVNGQLLHGLLHPEAGHMRLPRDPQRDPFTGACPYHGDCFEGLACGPAMAKRWGQPAETLPADHPAWQLEAHYIALAVMNLTLVVAPQKIVIGGGVMQQSGVIEMVRREVVESLNGYLQTDRITRDIDQFIVLPALGNQAGMLGAIALAQVEHERA